METKNCYPAMKQRCQKKIIVADFCGAIAWKYKIGPFILSMFVSNADYYYDKLIPLVDKSQGAT